MPGKASGHNGGDNSAAGRVAPRLERNGSDLIESLPQFRCEFVAGVGTLECQRSGRYRCLI